MQEEADKLMKHEAVRKAYEHFLLMCELTKEKQNGNDSRTNGKLVGRKYFICVRQYSVGVRIDIDQQSLAQILETSDHSVF
jgi:hypothetical protein